MAIQARPILLAKRGNIDEIQAALSDPSDPAARQLLVRMLAIAPGEDGLWTNVLEQVAREDDDHLARALAIRALGERKGEAASEALGRLAGELDDPSLRRAAVGALGQHLDPAAVDALQKLLSAPEPGPDRRTPEFLAEAGASLSRILRVGLRATGSGSSSALEVSRRAASAMLAILGSAASFSVQSRIIGALASTRSSDHVAILRNKASDSQTDRALRCCAIEALGVMDCDEAPAALESVATTCDEPELRDLADRLARHRRAHPVNGSR